MRVSGGNFRPLYFFLQEDFTHTKSTKGIQANKYKKGSIFVLIKNIYEEESCLFDAKSTKRIQGNKNKKEHFYVHKKHLRGRKLLVWRFVLSCFLMFFHAFYVHKKHLKRRLLVWRFVPFYVFYAFYAHKKHSRRIKLLVWHFVLFMLFTLFILIKNI